MSVTPAIPLVAPRGGNFTAFQSKEDPQGFLEDLVSLEDYCYLVGMSEDYHCFYPDTLEAIYKVKQSLAEYLPNGVLPSRRVDSSAMLKAYNDNPKDWRQRLDYATDQILHSTQHLLLPFSGKGIVEEAIDHAFSNLVKHKTNTNPAWLVSAVHSSSGIFEKMVIQQAFYDTPVLPLQQRETLMLCAGLYQQLQRQHPPLACDASLEVDLIRLHGVMGFHAERHLELIKDETEGQGVATKDEAFLASGTVPPPSQKLGMIALQSPSTFSAEHISDLASLSRTLISIPSSTDAITGIKQALSYRVSHCLSDMTIGTCTQNKRQRPISGPKTTFLHHTR